MYKITNYIETELAAGNTVNNKQIRKICEQNGIDLDNHTGAVKEAVEIGLMHVARDIAQHSNYTTRQKYDRLIDLYNRQPYVGTVRTLNQMIKQQYSTPLPIAFLMSEFVKSKSNEALYFEPSAGNGFLTVALPQRDTICNEIDKFRLDNLCNEHYRKVTNQDGRKKFEYGRIFDGVVTNPPFIKEIDTMIFNALDCMKDNGRCAILRDGNNMFQDYYGTKHRSKFVGFYDRLLAEYNVVKIININSKKIYAKQGTAFFMHIILIDGRRSTPNDTPKNRVFNPEIDKTELAGFEELWEYFSPCLDSVESPKETPIRPITMREVLNQCVRELGYKEGNETFIWYCQKYNVGIADEAPQPVIYEVFGLDSAQYANFRMLKKIPSELLEKELELWDNNNGLGSLDPDFVIEYHCNGEIYYDLGIARKSGYKIKAAICGIDITTNISDTDTEEDVAEKLVKCEYEYVLHGLVNKYDKNLKEFEYYKVIFTNYTYICHVISLDKPYKIDIINRYDTISDNGVSGTNAFDNEGYRPDGEPHIHKLFPQTQHLFTQQTTKNDSTTTTKNRIKIIGDSCKFNEGIQTTQIAGLDGLTAEQWQNYLAQKEDWRAFQYKFGETPYHNNIITVRKPSNGGNGYIQYWFHCKKEEIERNTNIIDKVFNVLIDEFPDWKTLNPIITYKPDKDTLNKGYYMVKRELRFTPKEGEKFLQVIPFYLKLTTISPDNIKFEDNSFIIPTLKFCKFQTVAEKVSELAIKEMDLLKLISLDERIRLNFSDAPEKVVKNLISNSWIIATQDEIRKHLQAINIKDVMWDLLANGNYTEETENYIITKGKDPKDKRMPKWVNIIYSYLCDIYGVKQRVE